MKKLNKSQTWEQVQALIQAAGIHSDPELALADGQITMVTELLSSVLAPRLSESKTDADGNVYCNYFDDYFAPEDFNKNSKDKFKANCKNAEIIIRKQRSVNKNLMTVVTTNYRQKLCTAADMSKYLEAGEAMLKEKYNDVSEIPTTAQLIGLDTDKTVKPSRDSK